MKFLRRLLKDEPGQDLIEYTLLNALIALTSAAGYSINSIWKPASNQLSNAAASAS
jgi:Flp pilus assembly pilin Flp